MKSIPNFAWALLWLIVCFAIAGKLPLEWVKFITDDQAGMQNVTRTEGTLLFIQGLLMVIAVAQLYQCRPWELFTKKRDGP